MDNVNTSKFALITGSTAGIGASFAELFAKEGFNLVLVARDERRLDQGASEISKTYGVSCEIIQADLSTDAGVRKVEERLMSLSNPIEVLVNNAGFGINKSFLVSNIDAEKQLLEVMVQTPMRLMHTVLPIMRARNSGTVINVSSVAGWIAGGTYSASKSYLTVLSESLNSEFRKTNINITALCPGFTRTEFRLRAQLRKDGLPNFMWLTSDAVAKKGWKDARKGKALSVPGWQYAILTIITRFGPRPLIRRSGAIIIALAGKKWNGN